MKSKKKKIGICGFFIPESQAAGGQSIKTLSITRILEEKYGSENIEKISTANWRKRFFSLLFGLIKMSFICKKIIVLVDSRGVKTIIPLLIILSKITKSEIIYCVVGGWLPDVLEKKKMLAKQLKNIKGILVETQKMLDYMKSKDFRNVNIMYNFKKLNIINSDKLKTVYDKPYKVCTFSRVIEKKGIDDAIKVIKEINEESNEVLYHLDIFGKIGEEYKEKFDSLIKSSPYYIEYKGIIDFEKTTVILQEYFLLLFPTRFKTEGLPGTILDAFAAGVPVLASEWNSAKSFIEQGKTGYVYEFNNNEKLKECLIDLSSNINKVIDIKSNCLKEAEKYLPEKAIEPLINLLEAGI